MFRIVTRFMISYQDTVKTKKIVVPDFVPDPDLVNPQNKNRKLKNGSHYFNNEITVGKIRTIKTSLTFFRT
jgi:hypothetical protein